MELRLKRIARKEGYTIGRLYADGVYVCDTLEDKDRGLRQGMAEDVIRRIKVKGSTAIPMGRYRVAMNVRSPKYSNFTKYKWSKAINGYVPRLMDVAGYEGVLIHVGNTASDTEGCILVGENTVKGKVMNSTATFAKVYALMASVKGDVWITVE